MDLWPIVVLVIVLAIFAVPIVAILSSRVRVPNAAMIERLEDLEWRIAKIEKTLNDIP